MTTADNTTFLVYSQATGFIPGSFDYDDLSFTLTFIPDVEFRMAGIITVIITSGLQTYTMDYLLNGHIWTFYTEISEAASGIFYLDATYPTGNWPTPITGGDFDNDGDIDLAVI